MVVPDGQGSEDWYFYHLDGLGSVVALSKWNSVLSQGEVVERYTYDAFGRTRIFDATGGELTQSAFGNPYMFTARRYDPETGLYHYRARAYSPGLGRFLQPDPIGYADSMNLYQYCLNNPIKFIDPFGLSAKGEWTLREREWEQWYEGRLGTGVSDIHNVLNFVNWLTGCHIGDLEMGDGTLPAYEMSQTPGVARARQEFLAMNRNAKTVGGFRRYRGWQRYYEPPNAWFTWQIGYNYTERFIGDYIVQITPFDLGSGPSFVEIRVINDAYFASFMGNSVPESWKWKRGPMRTWHQEIWWFERIGRN